MSFTGKAAFDAGSAVPELADDVQDLVGLIAPFDTPLLDTIGNPRASALSTRHEWLEKPLRSGSEAESHKRENFTQIFTETVTISDSMDAVGLHAVEREFDYQVIQRLRELVRSLEQSVICGFKATSNAANTVRRTMGGLLQFITGEDAAVHNAKNATLTEDLLNAAIKACHDKGGKPSAIVCNGFQKRKISAFVQASREYVPESSSIRNLVYSYKHEKGDLRVILSRWVPADKILLLDLDKIQVLPLQGRSFFVKPLAESSDYRKAQIIGEYTLEIQNAADGGHGVITDLATS